jgi:hypothetical protein
VASVTTRRGRARWSPKGGEGPHYDPWPELRTLVTERWKLQYHVSEGHMELDDLTQDPAELHPVPIREQPELV